MSLQEIVPGPYIGMEPEDPTHHPVGELVNDLGPPLKAACSAVDLSDVVEVCVRPSFLSYFGHASLRESLIDEGGHRVFAFDNSLYAALVDFSGTADEFTRDILTGTHPTSAQWEALHDFSKAFVPKGLQVREGLLAAVPARFEAIENKDYLLHWLATEINIALYERLLGMLKVVATNGTSRDAEKKS